MRPPNPTLDYDSPPPPRGSGDGWFIFVFLYAAAMVGAMSVILGLVVPRFATIFKDFGTTLPAITMLMLRLSDGFVHHFGWAGALSLPFIIAASVHALDRGSDLPAEDLQRRRRRVRLIFVLVTGLLIGLTIFALFLPMISLVDAVSNPRK